MSRIGLPSTRWPVFLCSLLCYVTGCWGVVMLGTTVVRVDVPGGQWWLLQIGQVQGHGLSCQPLAWLVIKAG